MDTHCLAEGTFSLSAIWVSISHPVLLEYKNVICPVCVAFVDAEKGIVELESKKGDFPVENTIFSL